MSVPSNLPAQQSNEGLSDARKDLARQVPFEGNAWPAQAQGIQPPRR